MVRLSSYRGVCLSVATALSILAIPIFLKGQTGVKIIRLLPPAAKKAAFSVWWAARPTPRQRGMKLANVVRVKDYTDPSETPSLRLYQVREKLVDRQGGGKVLTVWWHSPLPVDARCNNGAGPTPSSGRGCEVAVARSLLAGSSARLEFDEWLREGSWRADADSIRLKVDELTEEGRFLTLLPSALSKVRAEVAAAQRTGIRKPPVVIVNEKEIDSDDPELVAWAVELETRDCLAIMSRGSVRPKMEHGRASVN